MTFFVVTNLGKVTTLKILTQKYGILECHYNTIYIYNIFLTKYYKHICTLFCSEFFVVTYLGKVTTLKIFNTKIWYFRMLLQCYIYILFCTT